MAQPWLKYGGGQPATAAPTSDVVIKEAPIYADDDQRLQVKGDQRADNQEARAQGNDRFNQTRGLSGDFEGLKEVQTYKAAMAPFVSGLKSGDDAGGDMMLVNAYAKVMDPGSAVMQGEQDGVKAASPQTAQYVENLKREFHIGNGGTFPVKIRRELREAMLGRVKELNRGYSIARGLYEQKARGFGLDPELTLGAHFGRDFLKEIEGGLAETRGVDMNALNGQPVAATANGTPPPDGGSANSPVMVGGLPKGTDIEFGMDKQEGPFDRAAYLQKTYGITPDQEALITGFWNANRGNTNLTPDAVNGWYQQNGLTPPEGAGLIETIKNARAGKNFGGIDTSEPEKAYTAKLQSNLDARGFDPSSGDAYGERFAGGVVMGGGDELSGIGGALHNLFTNKGVADGYTLERDSQRLADTQMREQQGVPGYVAELGGNLVSGAIIPGGAIKGGAIGGGVAGFNYGEGFQNSLLSAAGGAATGATMGLGMEKGMNALSSYTAQRAANRATQAPLGPKAAELAAAGAAEGVNVNRAMVDPKLQNRVTGVDASMVGGPRVQAGMREVEGQIEGRVTGLGQGGKAMERMPAGDTYKGASERFIETSGKSARRRYDRAEQLAGDAKVTPRESLQRADDMIATLGETPNTNATEIAFLQSIRDDLSKDLTVGGLRRMRTSLRKKISNGDLVFGEDEARVLSIMDGAADDIRTGLTAQGKGNAAQAFDSADKAYRARMEYITGTVQKVIGKRNANLSSEAVADRLTSMARSKDAVGLRKFFAALTPEERTDVAATFADQLGRNGKDGFSVSHFMTQTKPSKFSDHALTTIFGKEGAESIKNLRTLGAEVERVTGAMNSRKSGTAVGNDYRSWLGNLILGAGSGLATGGNALSAAVGTGVTLGAKAGRDVLSARALLSPDISKWLAQAPRTTNPAAINAHIKRLSGLASVEEAKALQRFLSENSAALNDNVGVAAAAGDTKEDKHK